MRKVSYKYFENHKQSNLFNCLTFYYQMIQTPDRSIFKLATSWNLISNSIKQ
ncbi:hypothetical protein DDB_G0273575 [Dictyostelium discoideum AX4]|uniref:Uncharacterized protein n=1 Tax=Dictyostelium discoideum TaxID=44689 RepID=Q557G5_DICDI|nr:hypothetical protein DDB_G0273403 [Dictyostelium discoideum AX4]XP_644670.1 hypothetical protein DDB_G0273575 [Dictyostelium discoideum AX4]EAL70656.1 hypothetical protein DDB_G0273403 [Dictyostelium discoideum AX4]EAL70742.1 hypothetical protein DDB_G0273575 [Dictyostelium discoideum AX4]|eukprot:XP_644581.1 hypothetical protein DDB_G0273403 [Dictyostelium discoideum AX4]